MPRNKITKVDLSQRVIQCSGGLSSAMMTLLLKPTTDDIIIFTDTGREFPATYKFLDDIEKNEGIKIHRIENKETFSELVIRKKTVPNMFQRFCTQELKIRASKRYLRSLGIQSFTQFIGFRADEQKRIRAYEDRNVKVQTEFPLDTLGINKAKVEAFWKTKSYSLEIPRILGNCDLCFLKGKQAIVNILTWYPALADKWIMDERKTGRTYFEDISYSRLLEISKSQPTLFSLQEEKPTHTCQCGP